MSQNPYTAPSAQLNDTNQDAAALYSPTQAAVGAFLGGPIGLIYFVRANFVALEKLALAKKTTIFGVVLILVLLALLPVLPENFPSIVITIGYVLIARHVVEGYQLKKENIENSERYDFQSNWKVFGLGIVCLILSTVVIMVPLLLMAHFGIVSV